MEAQTEQSQKFYPHVSEGGGAGIARQHEVEQLATVEELNAKLVMVLQKRERAFEQVLSFPVASVLFKCLNSQLSRKQNFSQQPTVNSQQSTANNHLARATGIDITRRALKGVTKQD